MCLRKCFGILTFLCLVSILHGQKDIELKEKKSKFGFYQGKQLVSPQEYDEVEKIRSYYKVRINDKWGVVDRMGQEQIPLSYDTIKNMSGIAYIAALGGRYGAVDTMNELVIPFEFEDIDHVMEEGRALVKSNAQWAYWMDNTLDFSSDTLIFRSPDTPALYEICEGTYVDFNDLKSCANTNMLMNVYRNLKYPFEARDRGIEGMVVTSFLVSPEGAVLKHLIERSVHPSLDNESLRVIKSFNNWIPAQHEGKAVWSKYYLPIRFKLE